MPSNNFGRAWPSERSSRRDPISGALVHQLTRHLGHSNHAYFTNPCWHDHDRRLVFMSDRGNRSNYFSLELATGAITQLTDFDPADGALDALSLCKNTQREEVYFYLGRALFVLDLISLAQRHIYDVPAGMRAGNFGACADGVTLLAAYGEDLSHRFPLDLENGYVGFREYWAARPHHKIVRIDTRSGHGETVHEEDAWVGHVLPSPTVAHALTFCHEGPWHEVDARIWALDLRDGNRRPLRPTTPEERVGHEYWLADGLRVGYHGLTASGPIHGIADFASGHGHEAACAHDSTHFSSRDADLIVGDGNREQPCILLWRRDGDAYEQPRILCQHRGSMHVQRLHVHPLLSPDGRSVLFTADPQGYGQLFLAELPEVGDLPLATP